MDIMNKIKPDSIVYTNHYRSYSVLDVSKFKQYLINHSQFFADKQNHINGIESFWNQTKRHMRNLIVSLNYIFLYFLKEYKRRFNNPNLNRN
jgi:transposase